MGNSNELERVLSRLDKIASVDEILNWTAPGSSVGDSLAGLAIGTWRKKLSYLRNGDEKEALPSAANLDKLIQHLMSWELAQRLTTAACELDAKDREQWGEVPDDEWVRQSVAAAFSGRTPPESPGLGSGALRSDFLETWNVDISALRGWRSRLHSERQAAKTAKRRRKANSPSAAVEAGVPAGVSAPDAVQTTRCNKAQALLLKERIERRQAMHEQLTKLLAGEVARPVRSALAAQLAPSKERAHASAAQLTASYLEIPPLDVPKKISQAYAGLTRSDKRQLREWVRYLLPELAVEVTRRAAAYPTDPPHAGLLVAPGVSYAFAACLNAALKGRPVSLHSSGSRDALDAPGRMSVKVDRIGAGGLAIEIAKSENQRIFADGALEALAPDLVDTVTNWYELVSACEVHNDMQLDSTSNPLHMVFRPNDGVGHDWLVSFVSELPADLGIDVIHLKKLSQDVRLFEQQLTRIKPLFQDSPE